MPIAVNRVQSHLVGQSNRQCDFSTSTFKLLKNAKKQSVTDRPTRWPTSLWIVFEMAWFRVDMSLMLFCSNLAHFSEIQLMCDGPTDSRTLIILTFSNHDQDKCRNPSKDFFCILPWLHFQERPIPVLSSIKMRLRSSISGQPRVGRMKIAVPVFEKQTNSYIMKDDDGVASDVTPRYLLVFTIWKIASIFVNGVLSSKILSVIDSAWRHRHCAFS